VRDTCYFDEYVRNGSRQFFIYDFTKKEVDNDSMIGITLDKDGYNLFQHLKDDTSIKYGTSDFVNQTSRLSQIHKAILLNGYKPEEINEQYKKESIVVKLDSYFLTLITISPLQCLLSMIKSNLMINI